MSEKKTCVCNEDTLRHAAEWAATAKREGTDVRCARWLVAHALTTRAAQLDFVVAADVGGTNCRVALARAPLQRTHELAKFQGAARSVPTFCRSASPSIEKKKERKKRKRKRKRTKTKDPMLTCRAAVSDVRDMHRQFAAIGEQLAKAIDGAVAAAAAICVAGPGASPWAERSVCG